MHPVSIKEYTLTPVLDRCNACMGYISIFMNGSCVPEVLFVILLIWISCNPLLRSVLNGPRGNISFFVHDLLVRLKVFFRDPYSFVLGLLHIGSSYEGLFPCSMGM